MNPIISSKKVEAWMMRTLNIEMKEKNRERKMIDRICVATTNYKLKKERNTKTKQRNPLGW